MTVTGLDVQLDRAAWENPNSLCVPYRGSAARPLLGQCWEQRAITESGEGDVEAVNDLIQTSPIPHESNTKSYAFHTKSSERLHIDSLDSP